MPRALRLWLLLALVAAAALGVALASGSSDIALRDLPRLLLHPDDSPAAQVLHALRLPRALSAFACGALLALAGALMQVLLRNPLADPYVLGTSGGAAVGSLLALMLGGGMLTLQLGAFAGALGSTLLLFGLARRAWQPHLGESEGGVPRLLLTGVMLAALWAAVTLLLLTLVPEGQLRGMLFWLSGDLAGADAPAWPLAALALLLLLAWPLARELNLLLRGAAGAQALGVEVTRLRRRLYVLASLASAVAVAGAGTVGFVGLVVPHALRLLVGNDQRVLLPACALGGGTLLLLADTLARTVVAPQQLPVGVVMALVGAPAFIALLLRGEGARR
ncbi:FecCD family ABC transporter permease [Azohydromonas aeria]|uniref:FecCD family ABC transporter permease n=1 Tax=Azohydromonas aeria TaxID=2590212 RepID=UPI0012FAEB42|nr:iron ABC transporter permease [Azohydromonas aeria]